jgi:hypothetical protein
MELFGEDWLDFVVEREAPKEPPGESKDASPAKAAASRA